MAIETLREKLASRVEHYWERPDDVFGEDCGSILPLDWRSQWILRALLAVLWSLEDKSIENNAENWGPTCTFQSEVWESLKDLWHCLISCTKILPFCSVRAEKSAVIKKKLVPLRQIFRKGFSYSQQHTNLCSQEATEAHSQTWLCLKAGGTGFKSIRGS